MIKRLLAFGVATTLVLAAAGGVLVLRRPTPGEAVAVEIPAGATTTRIAEMLTDQRVIGSVLGFRIMSRVRGLDGRIQAGRFELHRGMGVQAALDVLSRPPTVPGELVGIPEGFSIQLIAERLAERTHLSREAVGEAATSGEIRASIQPEDVSSLEGFLFPETYFVQDTDEAADVVRRMVAEFERRTADLDWTNPSGLSPYEVLVAASLVEREARVDEDRAKIAAVIHNRLAIGMRLQIDITALYGLDEHKVPTRADLRRPSPHNTYLIDGLPPTPIANPGLPAIEAVLDPADIDALYYVVIDPSGRHGFTADFEEFQRLMQQRPPEVRGG